ncbi:smile protein, putative, partial [Ixodes scapularis]
LRPWHVSRGVRLLAAGGGCGSGWLRDALQRTAVLLLGALCLLAARVHVMGAQLPVFTKFDNPAAVAPSPARQLTFSYLLPLNSWLLLCPWGLCCDWTMGSVPLVESFMDPRNAATLALLVALVALTWTALFSASARHSDVIFFRILYLPSMGVCLLVAHGWDALLRNAHGVALRSSGVQPDDIGAHINVGRTYNNLLMYEEAEKAFWKLYRQAISMRVDYIQAYINRGDILIKLNRTKEAQEVYQRALQLDATNADIHYNLLLERGKANERVYFNLGMLSMDESKPQDAERWFQDAIRVKADFRSALFNLALLLSDSGRHLEAVPHLLQYQQHMKESGAKSNSGPAASSGSTGSQPAISKDM